MTNAAEFNGSQWSVWTWQDCSVTHSMILWQDLAVLVCLFFHSFIMCWRPWRSVPRVRV